VQWVGDAVLPWLPIKRLTDAEWSRVRLGEQVPHLGLEPPAWPLPRGFPLTTWARLMHGERLVAVSDGTATTLLPGGI
jgi:hypothetical protein